MACVLDRAGRHRGVFTDGDLRRLIERRVRLDDLTAGEAYRRSRRGEGETVVARSTVAEETLAVEALRMMKEQEITVLVVLGDGGEARGVVRLQDVVRRGIETAPEEGEA
jgi:arabinose-5-phosphate isomerase